MEGLFDDENVVLDMQYFNSVKSYVLHAYCKNHNLLPEGYVFDSYDSDRKIYLGLIEQHLNSKK